MIIVCEQCNKKFEIESKLIPENGRLLKCGSCEHVWFYKNEVVNKSEKDSIQTEESVKDSVETEESKKDSIEIEKKKKYIKSKKKNIKPQDYLIEKNDNKNKLKIKKIGFINIILVFLISFVALVILLETFKNPIIKVIPNLDFLLTNLYEVIKDIILFIEDLIN